MAATAKSLQSCPTLRPHRQQPTKLPCPWDYPGKNTGVGCHFLLQCMQVKSESGVAQSCLTLSDPMDCSLPGSSTQGIFQARVLAWGCHWKCFSSVQSLSRVRLFAIPRIAARQASLSITNSQSSRRLTSTESVMPSSFLIQILPNRGKAS